MKKQSLFFILFFAFLFPKITFSQTPPWSSEITRFIENGAVYVESSNGETLFDLRGKDFFIPASTLKLATGLAALELLGKDYRFKTEFYLDSSNNLYVKGYGDPYLVSEELKKIAKILREKGLQTIHQIILDASFFEKIEVPGISTSPNPYDALNSALSANFNTIFIQKNKKKGIFSAEPQTPMTELTRNLAKRAPFGKSRINLAAHPNESVLYVGYLLKAFLEKERISTEGSIQKGEVHPNAKLIYQHLSSKNLEEVVQVMMEYSNNFVANQIFLVLGAEKLGAPANLRKGKEVVSNFLKNEIGISNFNLEEGSGISRDNQISSYDLVKTLKAFEKYRFLLPEKLDQIQAKTGTLNG